MTIEDIIATLPAHEQKAAREAVAAAVGVPLDSPKLRATINIRVEKYLGDNTDAAPYEVIDRTHELPLNLP